MSFTVFELYVMQCGIWGDYGTEEMGGGEIPEAQRTLARLIGYFLTQKQQRRKVPQAVCLRCAQFSSASRSVVSGSL